MWGSQPRRDEEGVIVRPSACSLLIGFSALNMSAPKLRREPNIADKRVLTDCIRRALGYAVSKRPHWCKVAREMLPSRAIDEVHNSILPSRTTLLFSPEHETGAASRHLETFK